MQQQEQKPPALQFAIPWLEAFHRLLILLPSLSVMVLIRRRIGFRLLGPLEIFGMTVLVGLVGFFANSRALPFKYGMEWYAVTIFVAGCLHRILRWRGFVKGNHSHSWDPGTSIFQGKRTAKFLRAQRRINRFADPLLLVLIGYTVSFSLSLPLGCWLIYSAFALVVFENSIYQQVVERDLDIADGLVAAEVQADTAAHFGGGANAGTVETSKAISTGLGADIHRAIQVKKKGQ